MHKKYWLFFITLGFLACVITSVSAKAQNQSSAGQEKHVYHNQRGTEFFEKGFYDLTPKNKRKEAEQYYRQAIAEFNKAIAAKPDFEQAHRNLARLYYVMKDFEKAAETYRNVVKLDPSDLDSYVNLALALLNLERYYDAIDALEEAKAQTSDSSVIEKLDGYIHTILENR
jgi:tetratricopeptide (TPR) repeat protein